MNATRPVEALGSVGTCGFFGRRARCAGWIVLVGIVLGWSARLFAQGATTLTSKESYGVAAKPYVILRRDGVEAVVVDNRAVDDAVLPGHRAGYHGLGSLRVEAGGTNLFVPAYSGLNFEHIHDGTPRPREQLFEPRNAPMELRVISPTVVELYQAPTPVWGVESCSRYELLEGGVVQLTFECRPHRRTWTGDYLGLFWASYIHQPESTDIHFIGRTEGGSAGWIRGVTPSHGVNSTHRGVGDRREFTHAADFPLTLVFNESGHRYAEPWYFGVQGRVGFAQVFRREDAIRFTQSPSGGGRGNPAWDFQHFIEKPEIGRVYGIRMRSGVVGLGTARTEEEIRGVMTKAAQGMALGKGAAGAVGAQGERDGIARRHPGDVGIGADPAVLFHEDFESGDLAAVVRRWGSANNKEGAVLGFSRERSPGSRGARSLQVTATLGKDTGGDLYTRLPRGEELVHARFYVRFDDPAEYVHHFVTLGGYHPATAWPQGGAGERPRGDDRFTVGIEPYGGRGRYAAPGAWNFYAYWSEMKASAGGRYWGQSIIPVETALVPRARWQCVEVMVRCNISPDRRDGELGLWLDGVEVMRVGPGTPRGEWTGMGFPLVASGGVPFEGFLWRTDLRLKVNFFWLMHYVTENAARQNGVANPGRVNRVWFDDIVVATGYIGPIQP